MLNPKTNKKWKVYIAIPSTGTVSDFQPFVLRDLQSRYSDEIEFVYPEQLCQRIFHDAAREGLVQDFLATDCDILWFLDSDICPPKHVLDLVTMHGDKWQAAGAAYPVFMASPGEDHRQVIITAYKASGPDKIAPCPIPEEGTEFVDGLATGCLMIKREVFDKLERPYFEFKFDPILRTPILGEDIGFCIKLHKLGIKFFTDYSMVCKHFKNNIDLLEMNNYAMSYAKKCVDRYAANTKAGLMEVDAKFRALMAENKALKEQLAAKKSSLIAPNGSPIIYK